MSTDLATWASDPAGADLTGQLSQGLTGSRILAIAGHVQRLMAEGRAVANLTIGDFDPKVFPIPDALRDAIEAELRAGQTNYPPAIGLPELRDAIRATYAERLGLAYPDGCVLIGAGARPPIYTAFRSIVDPGDVVIYPVPTWNVRYYAYLCGAEGVPLVTRPEDGFMPTAAELLPHLPRARMVVLNSPLNPSGTMIREDLLREVCEAILDENRRRRAAGRRPVVLLYDQVYWQLTFDGRAHLTPPGLIPEMAAYTVLVDAISKCWAATGVRVGWAVGPQPLIGKMAPLMGHIGAWAARAEQRATAKLLREPARVAPFMTHFLGAVRSRLDLLADGLGAMRAEGLPVDCIAPQGAIYLSARFDLVGRTIRGRTIDSDEALRALLLDEAGLAVVPFSAFGYPDGTGWVRLSVGAVTEDACDGALDRLRALLTSPG